MGMFGGNQPAPDDYGDADDCDLTLLNPYVLLNTFCFRNVDLHRRILAQWEAFMLEARDEAEREPKRAEQTPSPDPATWRALVGATVLGARASVECSQGLRQEAAHLREEARRLRGEASPYVMPLLTQCEGITRNAGLHEGPGPVATPINRH